MPYSLKLLYSGSSGNAALLSDGETHVLIDAGRTAKALTAALEKVGVLPSSIQAVFLTHEHSDHTAALDVFLKRNPMPVHAATASAERLLARPGDNLHAALVAHPPLFSHTVGPFYFQSFATSHDSAASIGYRITYKEVDGTVHEIGYATDLGVVTPAVEQGLCGCEAVVLECNHNEEMLRTGPSPYDLKRRVASRRGHLSNVDCAIFASRLATNGTQRILLAHLSEINNLPELALGEVKAALAGTNVQIAVAAPNDIVEL